MVCQQCGREFKARGRQRLCLACKPRKEPLPVRGCKRCGKEFQPRRNDQVYCSRSCQVAARTKPPPKVYTKTCPVCQQSFETYNKSKVYCSDECHGKYPKKPRPVKGGPDRELTRISLYMIHKDAAKGMKLVEIAKLYNRSLDSVRKALMTPLPPKQEEAIESSVQRK